MQYIPALVIQKNNTVFINGNGSGTVGSLMEIPTPDNGGYIDGDVWAIPVNEGVYAGFNYQPYNPSNPVEATQPLFSVAAVKISSRTSSDYFIVVGTAAQYVTASGGGTALPAVWPSLIHTTQKLPVCQQFNLTEAGLSVLAIGAPSFDDDAATVQSFYPFGYFNGIALPTASSTGYYDLNALLSFLNTATVTTGTGASTVYTGGWAVMGTWTKTSDNLTVVCTQADGDGTDIFCGALLVINPSS